VSYIKGKSFKIISRFYVIYGDYEPIYVGYTNRTVKQRFKEHKADKDFSEYDSVEVKELVDEKLRFDFTWDYEQTCKNADKVSLREGQLVQQYGTQDSMFQKADGGGQTWAAEKWFVKSNKNNPRLTGLSGVEIKRLLKEEKVVSVWLNSIVGNMKPDGEIWLGNFVNDMEPIEKVWLHNFVCHMKPVEKIWLNSFICHMRPTEEEWLGHFVESMNPVEKAWLNSFTNNMRIVEERWLRDFVGHMKPIENVWLGSFISDIKPVEEIWLGSFISNMKKVEEIWLGHFVGHMKQKRREF